jgi:hypothetical protein
MLHVDIYAPIDMGKTKTFLKVMYDAVIYD